MSHATEAIPAGIVRENEAVVSARERLALQKQAIGEHHPDYATGLNQLAMLLIMHGDPDRAEPLLRQALEIRREVLGEKHADFATNLSSLAGLFWARGDLDGAEPLMRQALDIRWDVLGSNHPKTTTTLNSLEQLLRAKQDWEGVDRPAAAPSSVRPPAAPGVEVVEPAPAPALAASVSTDVPAEPPADEPMVPPQRLEPAMEELSAGAASADEVEARPVGSRPEPGVATSRTRDELIGRQAALAAQFARVGERLAREAEEWKAGGAPPSPALIEELDVCGRDFEQLRAEVVQLADSLGAASEPTPLANLDEITHLLQFLGEAEGRQAQLEAVRGQALATLDRVLALAAADGSEFAPLVACQARARADRTAIAEASVLELPADATRLAEGDHPFHSLLTLVEEGGLSDDLWTASLESVESEFGKPLSVAVARSKIVRP
ncbi:tetratricopeptide repeat protein [Singulisphaera sp. GP187]|uniref:tetratricopeptide repeat protein n=1 Tax=Singulisphaera sp. GP187 TaxID=1882752 RepID=UPI0020B15B9F|nr:tetratricopeptide repeat protein [Singulisphaera sp. GP187]